MHQDIKEFISNFFDRLCVDIDKIEIFSDDENIYSVKVETTDSGILIGNHGSVFESLQSILRKIVREKFGNDLKIHLEINDYIYSKDARLFAFIDKEISKAKEIGRNMKLPSLSSYERKKVHSYIANLNDNKILTQSRGKGKERRLFIVLEKNNSNNNYTPKNQPNKSDSKFEIDIDGNNI